jgi:hypothetical protein
LGEETSAYLDIKLDTDADAPAQSLTGRPGDIAAIDAQALHWPSARRESFEMIISPANWPTDLNAPWCSLLNLVQDIEKMLDSSTRE